MPDPTVPITADDLTRAVSDAICDRIPEDIESDHEQYGCSALAETALDALASMAGTDRGGLVARLAPPPGWFLDRDGHGTRALWLGHPGDPWPLKLADEYLSQAPLWDWLGTVIPTRTEGDTPDA